MKKIIVLAGMFLISFNLFARQDDGYTIQGNIKGLPDNIKIYLIRTTSSRNPDTVATVLSKNENFLIKGSLQREGELHFVKIDTSIVKIPPPNDSWMRLMLDNSEIQLNGTLQEWPRVQIDGSIPTKEYEELVKIVSDSFAILRQRIGAAGGDSVKIEKDRSNFRDDLLALLISNKQSYAAPILMTKFNWIQSEYKEKLYSRLPDSIKESYYGVNLLADIRNTRMRNEVKEGRVIPEFTILSPEGKELSIRDIVGTSKLTLIDFWASWCKPCRAQIPELKKVYKKFHDKGFNIVGVSTDHSSSQWKKALGEEDTPWVNGIIGDIKVDKEIFGLKAIPAYVLVDETGKMLAFARGLGFIPSFGPHLRGENLYQTIESIMGDK